MFDIDFSILMEERDYESSRPGVSWRGQEHLNRIQGFIGRGSIYTRWGILPSTNCFAIYVPEGWPESTNRSALSPWREREAAVPTILWTPVRRWSRPLFVHRSHGWWRGGGLSFLFQLVHRFRVSSSSSGASLVWLVLHQIRWVRSLLTTVIFSPAALMCWLRNIMLDCFFVFGCCCFFLLFLRETVEKYRLSSSRSENPWYGNQD